jgi:hypothetical protein
LALAPVIRGRDGAAVGDAVAGPSGPVGPRNPVLPKPAATVPLKEKSSAQAKSQAFLETAAKAAPKEKPAEAEAALEPAADQMDEGGDSEEEES